MEPCLSPKGNYLAEWEKHMQERKGNNNRNQFPEDIIINRTSCTRRGESISQDQQCLSS
jgi:hypothetical protein